MTSAAAKARSTSIERQIYVSSVQFPSLRPLRKRRSSLPRALVALGLVVATAVTAAVALAASPKDHAAQAWNVLPPGQAGGVAFTKNSTDQIALYEGLTLRRDRVTDADLRRYFKRETLGLGSEKAVRTERPRAGVTITRDRWGVPHVKGRTAEDVAFGAGWATAADRQLIMELLRGPGRIAALDAPGINAFAFALSGQTFRPSAATEARLAQQFDLLRAQGAQGRQAIRLIDAYVAGINAQYRKAGLPLPPWTRNDVVAVGGLMGAVFGSGGGQEVRRSQFLALLQTKLGAETGRRVWEDLRQRDDPEARVAVTGRFERDRAPGERGRQRRRRRGQLRAGGAVRRRDDPPADVERAARRRQALGDGQAAVRRRPAGRPLLSGHPARARPRGRRLQGARRSVPRDLVRRPPRPRDRLRVERDVRRLGSRRRVRRDALRRRHGLPPPRRVPADDDVRRGDDRRPAGRAGPAARLPRDRPRAGEGVRDGRAASASRSRRGARREDASSRRFASSSTSR